MSIDYSKKTKKVNGPGTGTPDDEDDDDHTDPIDTDEPIVDPTPTDDDTEDDKKDDKKDKKETPDKKTHSEGKSDDGSKEDEAPEDGEPNTDETVEEPMPDEHDKTDWSQLDNIDTSEFIDKRTGDIYVDEVNRLKQRKIKLGRLTETLNGLTTTTRQRTYKMPSTVYVGSEIILKGKEPGRAKLYLCFDASGSMGCELATFKDIITQSIPQALTTPTAWFSGHGQKIRHNPEGRSHDYYKGTFKDILPVEADNGYNDDGDRTIELCWIAEQAGYSPIGITDGGGSLTWSVKKLKELKRTIFVGQNPYWLEKVKEINPNIQTLDI